MPNDQWGKNPEQLECGCLNYFYDKLYPLFFFRPRYCFRYLAIRMKYYFNIICQCFSYCHFQRQLTTNRKLNQTGSVHDIHQRSRSWDRNQMSFRWFELIICLLCQFLIGTWHTFCNLGCPLPIYIQVQLYRSYPLKN